MLDYHSNKEKKMRSGTPIRHKSGLKEWRVWTSNAETGDSQAHGKVKALQYVPNKIKMLGYVELVEIIIEE